MILVHGFSNHPNCTVIQFLFQSAESKKISRMLNILDTKLKSLEKKGMIIFSPHHISPPQSPGYVSAWIEAHAGKAEVVSEAGSSGSDSGRWTGSGGGGGSRRVHETDGDKKCREDECLKSNPKQLYK